MLHCKGLASMIEKNSDLHAGYTFLCNWSAVKIKIKNTNFEKWFLYNKNNYTYIGILFYRFYTLTHHVKYKNIFTQLWLW